MSRRSDSGGTHNKPHATLQKTCIEFAKRSYAHATVHATGNRAVAVRTQGAFRSVCPQHLLASSKGIPDVLVFDPSFDDSYAGLAIEFKIPPDTLKPDQQKWFGQLQSCKWRCVQMYHASMSNKNHALSRCARVRCCRCVVVREFDEFEEILRAHFGEPPSQELAAGGQAGSAALKRRRVSSAFIQPTSSPPPPFVNGDSDDTSQSGGGGGSSTADNGQQGGDEEATRGDRRAVRSETKQRRREVAAGTGVSMAQPVDLT